MIDWNGKKVLVTGAGGFIGSHLTERLVELGANTTALVHYRSDNSWGWLDQSPNRNSIHVISGDIRDRDSVENAMAKAEVVFHLAALIGIPYSYDAPVSYLRTNIEGTLNVLQSARNSNVARVIHTSTSEVYGSAQFVPITENHPLQGQSPYSASKIGADQMAQAFHSSFALPVSTVRPFNTYGPRQSARAVIPTIITQVLNQSEIRLGSLTTTRDFNFVADTVEGFIKIAECPDAVGQVVNIGTGQEISIGELAKTILELAGSEIPVVADNNRIRPKNSEVDRLLADNNKAQTLLSWSPKYTLKEGLAHTIAWIENNIGQYRLGTYTI